MRRFLLAAVVLLTACGAPPTVARPTGTASPSVAASAPSPTPTVSITPELAGDLPAISSNANGTGEIQHAGGFVHFPGGAFTADPKAAMVQDPNTHLWRTAIQPYLSGSNDSGRGRITYDPFVGRWIPVSRDQVSSDGLHYAYAEPIFAPGSNTQPGGPFITGVHIRVVDLPSGSDRIVFSATGYPFYTVVAYAAQGIYLTAGCVEGCGPEALKLWRVDLATGKLAKVSDRRGFNWLIRNHVAWVATYDESGQPSQLLRLDLTNAQIAAWLTGPGMQLIDTDADGSPLVTLNGGGTSAELRVTAPQQSERIFPGPSNGLLAAVADGSRTRLGGGPIGEVGIYLYTPASGARQVSDFRGLPLGPLR
ncbi:MAG: hypothetical protein E6I78_10745 [Chloroflexi bacterium]|nr:MAG: hypothetical protein E6I78_10745 [Chloroflexota bacterium]